MLAVAGAAGVPVAPADAGCVRRCGDIDVPYPFGLLEPHCAIHRGFLLDCNTTAGGIPKLYHGNMEVMKISVQDNKAWLRNYISRQCYNESPRHARMNITGTQYVLSREDNKVIVIGCKSLAYMLSNIVSLS